VRAAWEGVERVDNRESETETEGWGGAGESDSVSDSDSDSDVGARIVKMYRAGESVHAIAKKIFGEGGGPSMAKVRSVLSEQDSCPIQNAGLVRSIKFNKVGRVRFMSCRAWWRGTKEIDMAILKHAKHDCDSVVIDGIAQEIIETLHVFKTKIVYELITAPPPGVSAWEGVPHFATLIAQRVASVLGMTFACLFVPRPRSESSHPLAERGEVELEPVWRNTALPKLLILDDVATSGRTIESCIRLTGGEAIVWLYGHKGKGKESG